MITDTRGQGETDENMSGRLCERTLQLVKKDTETYSRVDKRVLGYERMVYLAVCEISDGILSRQVRRQVGYVELEELSGGTRPTVGKTGNSRRPKRVVRPI